MTAGTKAADQAIEIEIAAEPPPALPAVIQPDPAARIAAPPPTLPWLDPQRHALIEAYAKRMAEARLLPDTLLVRKDGAKTIARTEAEIFGTCFLLTNQAVLWRMDPFAVAQCVSMVHGRLGYEGKLIAAVVESLSGVRFEYEWIEPEDGNVEKLGIVCRGIRPGESTPREITGTVADWQTRGKKDDDGEQSGKVSAMWRGRQARTQLVYRSTREWARVWMPGVIFGISSADEIEDFDPPAAVVTEPPPAISAGFKPKPKAKAAEAAPATASEKESDPATAFTEDQVQKGLAAAENWRSLRQLVSRWLQICKERPEFLAAVRRIGWDHVQRLRRAAAFGEDFDLQRDMVLFGLFVGGTTEAQSLRLSWEGVQESEAYKALKPDQQKALAATVEARLKEIGK